MLRVEKIKHEIEELNEKEFAQIRHWFIEREWGKWDKQLERDSKEGRLDFLVREAQEEKSKGRLKPL